MGPTKGKRFDTDRPIGFEDMIAYLSMSETLYPGEFLCSGTVGGCCAPESGRWLEASDVVEIGFDRIGTLRDCAMKGTA